MTGEETVLHKTVSMIGIDHLCRDFANLQQSQRCTEPRKRDLRVAVSNHIPSALLRNQEHQEHHKQPVLSHRMVYFHAAINRLGFPMNILLLLDPMMHNNVRGKYRKCHKVSDVMRICTHEQHCLTLLELRRTSI